MITLENRQRLERLRDETSAFVGTPVHRAFVKSQERMIEEIEDEILDPEVTDIHRIMFLKGQRSLLKEDLTTFEDAVTNLEDRIQSALDEENNKSQNQTEEEEND